MDKSLARIDLNLLKALHALLEERSVTRAAERLHITQSAMSKSLTRLRDLFGDPLFVRTAEGLQPTLRAQQLAPSLYRAFVQVENCFYPARFDPASATGRIRIALPEQFALITIPRLVERLRAMAPGICIEAQHLSDDHLGMLAGGSVDFLIHLDQPYPQWFIAQRIYSSVPTLWCRRHHPLARKRHIDMADMCAYPQITFRAQNMTPADMQIVESALDDAVMTRTVILDTSHLLIALDVLCKSDAVMMAPDYLGGLSLLHGEIVPLSMAHVPAFERLRINLSLIQHERTRGSPLHRWVAEQIAAVSSATCETSREAITAA